MNAFDRWKEIRDIKFVYWGSLEIGVKLSPEEQAGRRMYFFNEEILTQRWFKERCGDAIIAAGPRYSAQINLALPISRVFEILGRTKKFHNAMKILSREIQNTTRYVMAQNSVLENDAKLTRLKSEIDEIRGILGSTDKLEQEPISFSQIQAACTEAREIIYSVISEPQTKPDEEGDRHSSQDKQTTDFESQKHHLYQLDRKLSRLSKKIIKREFQAANTGALLLRGEAGVGKTHLFCDVTKQRVEKGIANRTAAWHARQCPGAKKLQF